MSPRLAKMVQFDPRSSKASVSTGNAISVESISKEIQDMSYADHSVAAAIARAKLQSINRWNLNIVQRQTVLAAFHSAF